MHRHQIDGVQRFEDGIGFVPGSERVEVIRNPRERGIAAILNAADQTAHFFHVFPRLVPPGAPQFVRVRHFGKQLFDQVGGRNAIDPNDPARHVTPGELQRATVILR